MDKTKAYSIVDWDGQSSVNQHPIVSVLDPESPDVGEEFTVTVYCRHDVALYSPYQGIKSGRLILPVESFVEYPDISGNTASTDKPVKTINYAKVWTPLIDKVNHTIFKFGNVDAKSFVSVVLDKLTIKNFDDIHGTLQVDYTTYNGQQWTHKGFERHGAYILWAHDAVENIWHEISISISDPADSTTDDADSIEIQGVALQRSYYGLQGGAYANFIVLSWDNDFEVKCSKGEGRFVDIYEHELKGESLTLDGSGLQSLKWPVKTLGDYTGDFKTVSSNNIAGGFSCRVQNKKIAYTKGATGTLVIDYVTEAFLYDYFAHVNNIPGGIVELIAGTVFVSKNSGAKASYVIPTQQVATGDKQTVITVWYEVVVGESDNGSGLFELPAGYPSNMTYHQTFADADLLRRFPWPKQRINAEWAILENQVISLHYYDSGTAAPFNGLPFPQRKYHVEKSIPDDANASTVSEINAVELQLRAKYSLIGQVV